MPGGPASPRLDSKSWSWRCGGPVPPGRSDSSRTTRVISGCRGIPEAPSGCRSSRWPGSFVSDCSRDRAWDRAGFGVGTVAGVPSRSSATCCGIRSFSSDFSFRPPVWCIIFEQGVFPGRSGLVGVTLDSVFGPCYWGDLRGLFVLIQVLGTKGVFLRASAYRHHRGD